MELILGQVLSFTGDAMIEGPSSVRIESHDAVAI